MAAHAVTAAARAGFRRAWRRECRHLARERWDLAFVTLLPIAMLVLMAWLLSPSVMREIPVAVVDQDNSVDSRELLRLIDASPGVRIARQETSPEEGFAAVRRLDVYATVLVPRDFGRALRRGERVTVIDYYNGSYLTAGQSAARDIGDAVTAFNTHFLTRTMAAQRGPQGLRPAPVVVQSGILGNPARSYELFLLPLIAPALLSLVSALAMAAALGREIRDGTCAIWLGKAPVRAILGKLMPYVLLFTLYGLASLAYVGWIRGHGIAGSLALLAAGQFLLHLACAAVACFFAGVLRDMGSAMSLVGLSIGASLAFSGATFPTIGAPLFVRAWSAALPLTAYEHVQSQQMLIGSPWPVSLAPLGTLLVIAAVCGAVGIRRLAPLGRPQAVGGNGIPADAGARP
ncbi:ABC transporter permease [Verticiella sediminum]|uniref:ABC transporter permease n=1 Tax=Verticiella sediminum TaxID=1247510 RepID=A0A556AYD4_9BURK|nr:ABC transporter permease [Verticiella sediminum]TSH97932.1 ABC transporter permease [Verticiella sediminum]